MSRAGARSVSDSEDLARLGVSRAGSWRATDSENLALLRVSWAGVRRVTDSENLARLGVSRAEAQGVTDSDYLARLGASRAGFWKATDSENLARLRASWQQTKRYLWSRSGKSRSAGNHTTTPLVRLDGQDPYLLSCMVPPESGFPVQPRTQSPPNQAVERGPETRGHFFNLKLKRT